MQHRAIASQRMLLRCPMDLVLGVLLGRCITSLWQYAMLQPNTNGLGAGPCSQQVTEAIVEVSG